MDLTALFDDLFGGAEAAPAGAPASATPAPAAAPGAPAPAPSPVPTAAAPAAPSASGIPNLAAALKAAAPHADARTWMPALTAAFIHFEMADRPLRMSMALGQFAVEAGDGFTEIVEDTCYTTAARLVEIFPSEFPDTGSTEGYVGNATRIANRCYANKLGNGNEASGDGSKFRGRGLIQITGREEYGQLAAAFGMTVDAAAAWCETPAGAAMSGCWYLSTRGCLALADTWSISACTRKVNGTAMLGNAQRVAAANAARIAFGVAA